MTTMLIELTQQKAAGLLRELEELQLIRVLSEQASPTAKRSAKYRGMLTKEQGQALQAHINQMRNEWAGI